jgi:hypothetical protein
MTMPGIVRRTITLFSFEADIDRAAKALAVFRISLGLVVLWQAVITAWDLPMLVGQFGLMQRPINEAMAPPFLPRLSWFHRLWEMGLVTEHQLIYILLGLYLICLFYLIAGWRTSIFAAGSLFFHLLFKASGSASSYGAHELSTNGLFFCILLPVSSYYTLGRGTPAVDAFAVRLGRFVLRSYLSIVYVSSGIMKISGPAWRNGDAMWNFFMRPEVTVMNFGWLSHVPWLVVGMGWFTLLVELGYFLSLFSVKARICWFFATLLLHLGIGITFHLWFFSLTMIALNVGAAGGFSLRWRKRGKAVAATTALPEVQPALTTVV